MDLEEECRILEKQIKEISKKIVSVKDEIIELYDSDHLTPVLPHREKRMSLLQKNVSDEAYTTDALKCCFYQTFMTVREKEFSSNIVVAFPTTDKTVYGVEFKCEKDDLMSAEKINLPLYITPERIFKTKHNLTPELVLYYLDRSYRAIQVYKDRKTQLSNFKTFHNKIGNVSISPCHQVVRIATILSFASKGETVVHIVLNYDPMNFRPSGIDIYLENDILDKKKEKRFVERLKCFFQAELLEAYKNFFKLSD